MENYVTYKISPEKYKQIDPIQDDLDFLLSGGTSGVKNYNLLFLKDTETRLMNPTPSSMENSKTLKYIIGAGVLDVLQRNTIEIQDFLRGKIKRDLYDTFSIPKRSGGLRWIDAPKKELMDLQKRQQTVLEFYLRLIPHHNAHAYRKNRGIMTNAYYHKNSNHFCKVDFTKFFPSITKEMLEEVLPKIGILHYSEYSQTANIFRDYIKALIDLATLDDCLPQGTPISPVLSNIILTPFDYHLTEVLKEEEQSILVTRYADDIAFSSFYAFADRKEQAKERMEGLINKALNRAFSKPYISINQKKTIISTKNGKNRITGVKVNAENKLSIGYKEKRQLKQNIAALIIAKQQGNMDTGIKMEVMGYYNFLHAIEPDYAKHLINTLQRKFNLAVPVNEFLNG